MDKPTTNDKRPSVAQGTKSVCRNCGEEVQYDMRPRTGLAWTHCSTNERNCPNAPVAEPVGSLNITVDWPTQNGPEVTP